MKKIIISSLLIVSTILANQFDPNKSYTQEEIVKMIKSNQFKPSNQSLYELAKLVIDTEEIKKLKGIQLDAITKIKDIYVSKTPSISIVYEFSSDLEKLQLNANEINKLKKYLIDTNFETLCKDGLSKKTMDIGLTSQYLYKDTLGNKIVNIIINNQNCKQFSN